MKKEFIVERQGKNFVLYVGLLDMAHSNGLESILTQLVQVPTEENKRVAICTATVTMAGGKTFQGIGDAAPNNVAPAMQTCLIRMAETRAKARALRDATNIGVTAFEELDDEDATDPAPEAGYEVNNRATAPTKPAQAAKPAEQAITPAPETAWEKLVARAGEAGFMSFETGDYLALVKRLAPRSMKGEDAYLYAAAEPAMAWEEAIKEFQTKRQANNVAAVTA